MYYPSSENKDADQLRGYREADLHLIFACAEHWFSHDMAHIILYSLSSSVIVCCYIHLLNPNFQGTNVLNSVAEKAVLNLAWM